MTTPGPPRVPFVVSIGVTGHRSDALEPEQVPALAERLRAALETLRSCLFAVHEREAQWFAAEPPEVRLVSPLADGADQIAAEIALELGFRLQAVLPFDRATYRQTLHDEASCAAFDRLLGKSPCVLELPGDRDRELEAYVMTGRATVAHCDLLLAVWDGLSPRGRGGTGEVVELAIARGTPVIHVPLDPNEPERVLWAAFDPAVVTRGVDSMAQRPFQPDHVEQMLTALLLPPADPQERRFLQCFSSERQRRIRARIEYPLLLAVTGVARFGAKDVRNASCAEAIEQEWRGFRERCAGPGAAGEPFALLEASYSWADRLATHFAQTYRSGHIFNFLLGGLAVCLGLSSFMAPHARQWLAMVEFVIAAAVLLNTRIGVRGEWHRRWLDYRQLAERLRPMRSLKLLAIAAPDPPGTATNPVPKRWIDWYSSGIWRAMGCPAGAIDAARADRLGEAIAEHEIAPQVAYHQKSARQIEALDRRLERIAALLFWATLVVSAATAAGLWLVPQWVTGANNWFTLVSAGFPALGTAVFGIRFQGDFGGSALRSQATADALRYIESELRKDVSLARASDLTEQAARTMLADLDEWRLVNQQQDLDLA